MRVRDVTALAQDLKGYRSDWEDPVTRAQLVDGALPRLLATLETLPEGGPDSRLLELGSAPFFTSIALDREWPGKVVRANYLGTAEKRGSQRLINLAGGPPKLYEFDLFNIESDEFPYPDGTFDVVLFSELIEHLGLNPVWALSEIHRVLKPGGHVVVTTPNALSLERLETYLRGGSQMVDKYMPLLGYGARHNREYQPAELRELLETTGFDVEAHVVRDLGEHSRRDRVKRAAWKGLLRLWSAQPRDTHMFICARRRDVFRWYFPERLYDHMQMYFLIRHPYVEMGVNDAIQCGVGWGGLEDWKEWGGPVRKLSGNLLQALGMPATIFLRGQSGAGRVMVRIRASADDATRDVDVGFRVGPFRGDERLADESVHLPAGEWKDVTIALNRATADREELEVQIALPPGAEVAAKRFWLE